MPHIFDRYYQAQGKHQASGTGIGLALVKSLADLHEGTITAESEPGNGSKFTFTLLKDNTYPSALHKEDVRTSHIPIILLTAKDSIEDKEEGYDSGADSYLTEDLDMAFMTDKMAMSHSTFYRKVKALTGMSAKEYIRKLRLQRCAELLRSGNYNVTEAATMTGFNDLGHFREIFKQEFGVAPSEYLKRTLHR